MIRINNQELKKAFSDSTKTQMSEQPNLIDNSKVSPIIDVTPRVHKNAKISRTEANNTTAATAFTTSAKNDTYITGFTLGVIKDATATSTITRLQCVIDGATVNLAEIRGYTLTAQNQIVTQSFTFPIKIDKNTAVNITNSTNVANVTANLNVYYFEDEVM